MKNIIFITALLYASIANAQYYSDEELKNYDYSRVYNKVEAYNPPGSATKEEVVYKLLSFGNNQHEDVFALYLWMALKIDYDDTYTRYYADETFKHRSGVCNGYALLFEEMCDIAGVACEKVTGLAKGASFSSSKFFNDRFEQEYLASNHAWNRFKLYGKWYLTDITWAACLRGSGAVEYFWLCRPDHFAFAHFPTSSTYNYDRALWEYEPDYSLQLLKTPVDYELFVSLPDPGSRHFAQDPEYWSTTNFNRGFPKNYVKKYKDDNGNYLFNKNNVNPKDYKAYMAQHNSSDDVGIWEVDYLRAIAENDFIPEQEETLEVSDFDLMNEFERLVPEDYLSEAGNYTSDLFFEFKQYYSSGNMSQDIDEVLNALDELWQSKEVQDLKQVGKQWMNEGIRFLQENMED